MVNICELLINAVRTSKPKMLTGLSQKAGGPAWAFPLRPAQTDTATGEQAGPTPSVGTDMERGKPIILPLGRRAVRQRRWDGGYRRMEEAKAAL